MWPHLYLQIPTENHPSHGIHETSSFKWDDPKQAFFSEVSAAFLEQGFAGLARFAISLSILRAWSGSWHVLTNFSEYESTNFFFQICICFDFSNSPFYQLDFFSTEKYWWKNSKICLFFCNRGDTVSRRSLIKGVRPIPYATVFLTPRQPAHR